LFLALSICVLTVLWLNRQFQTRLAGTVFVVTWILVTLRMAIESTNWGLDFHGDLVFHYLHNCWSNSAVYDRCPASACANLTPAQRSFTKSQA
jgi:hypothetical protein